MFRLPAVFSRRLRHACLVVGAFVACAPALPAASAPSVKAVKTPAVIERRTFDPKKPPADLPKLMGPEAAVCTFEFRCDTRLGVEMPRYAFNTVTATINSTEVIARLKITVWTPTNASAVLREHEETHREICEVYYADAEDLARRLAERPLGRKTTVPKQTADADIHAWMIRIQSEIQSEFLALTMGRCVIAQERFDAITRHGLNPITNAVAKARALADEEAQRTK